jgi:DNA-binding NarL/FixJ family response regulator
MLREYEPPVLTPTAREREILQLAAAGLTTAEIAARLVISPATVKRHFQNVYPKLGAQDRTSAVARALRRRLIT